MNENLSPQQFGSMSDAVAENPRAWARATPYIDAFMHPKRFSGIQTRDFKIDRDQYSSVPVYGTGKPGTQVGTTKPARDAVLFSNN